MVDKFVYTRHTPRCRQVCLHCTNNRGRAHVLEQIERGNQRGLSAQATAEKRGLGLAGGVFGHCGGGEGGRWFVATVGARLFRCVLRVGVRLSRPALFPAAQRGGGAFHQLAHWFVFLGLVWANLVGVGLGSGHRHRLHDADAHGAPTGRV